MNFSQMKRDELYNVLKEFREEIRSTSARISEAERLVRLADSLLEGLDNKSERITAAHDMAGKVSEEIDKCRENVKQIESYRDDGQQKLARIEAILLEVGPIRDEIGTLNGDLRISTAGVKSLTMSASALKNRIERQKSEANSYFKQQKTELEALKSTVEGLVPQTALGSLVSSFYEAKLRYGDENNGSKIGLTRNAVISASLYTGFVFSLLMIVTIFLLPFITFNPLTFNFSAENNISVEGTLSRFLLSTPLLWIALHMSNKIKQRAALYEEYNYKQRLTTTYMGFIDKYKGEEANAKFTRELLKHINKPPSITKRQVYSETLMDVFSKMARGRNMKRLQEAVDGNEDASNFRYK